MAACGLWVTEHGVDGCVWCDGPKDDHDAFECGRCRRGWLRDPDGGTCGGCEGLGAVGRDGRPTKVQA